MRSSSARSNRGACKNLFSNHLRATAEHGNRENTMNTTLNILTVTLAAGLLAASALAQNSAPEIKFDSVPNAIQLPAGLYLGEVAGVATNSKGDIFVYTRTGHPTVTIGTMRPFEIGRA